MAVTPNTVLRLLKVPIELDNKNQLTFANKQAQEQYFLSLPYKEITEISYQRKDDIIFYPEHIDNIINYNYVMYKNQNYSDKWFYGFIRNMEYENDYNTRVNITTDVFQTWQFDITFKQSFIEREMMSVSEDVPGANLLPEGLEIGEVTTNGTAEFDELEMVPIIAYSGDSVPGVNGALSFPINQGGYIVNGIPSSVAFIICGTTDSFNIFMNAVQKGSYSDYLVSCFTVPRLAVSNFMNSAHKIDNYNIANIYILDNSNYNNNQGITQKTLVSTPNSLDGYTPRNQKLRTYPYLYVGFNPTSGSSKIYRYEDFANGIPQFNVMSEVNPNPTVVFIPQNYRKMSGNSLQDIATLNGYPTLSNRSDFFNSWLAQNGEIINLSMQQEAYNYEVGQVQTGLNMLNSIANLQAGGIISGAVSLAQNDVNHDFYVKQQMAQVEKQKLLPDKVNLGGSNATLLGYNMMDKNIFTRYNIKRQIAERIDKYFDMYGYLTNTLKIPNLNNRPNWNYVKTIGANIVGDIPQQDMQTIKQIFDNGVTLWHKSATFLDYSQNNR